MNSRFLIVLFAAVLLASSASAQGMPKVALSWWGTPITADLTWNGTYYVVQMPSGTELELNLGDAKGNFVKVNGFGRELASITATGAGDSASGLPQVMFDIKTYPGTAEQVTVPLPTEPVSVSSPQNLLSFSARWLTVWGGGTDDVQIEEIRLSKEVVQKAQSEYLSSGGLMLSQNAQKIISNAGSSYNVAELCSDEQFVEVVAPSKLYVHAPQPPYLFDEDANPAADGKKFATAITENGNIKYVVIIKKPLSRIRSLYSITRVAVLKPKGNFSVGDYQVFYDGQTGTKTLWNLMNDSSKMTEVDTKSLDWAEFWSALGGAAGGAGAGVGYAYLGLYATPGVGWVAAIATAAGIVAGGATMGIADSVQSETFAFDNESLLVAWDKETFAGAEAKITSIISKNRNCGAAQAYTKGCVEIPITEKMQADLLGYNPAFTVDYVAGRSNKVVPFNTTTELSASIKDGKLIVDGLEESKYYEWFVDGTKVGFIQTESTDIDTGQIKPPGECGK